MTDAQSLAQKPIVLKPDMTTEARDFTMPGFYEKLDADFDSFKGHVLISEYAFESDWGMWERHPHGDETIYLVSGAARIVLREAGQDRTIALDAPGRYVTVPRGVWHTALCDTPTVALFVTPGEGTEHAGQPPD